MKLLHMAGLALCVAAVDRTDSGQGFHQVAEVDLDELSVNRSDAAEIVERVRAKERVKAMPLAPLLHRRFLNELIQAVEIADVSRIEEFRDLLNLAVGLGARPNDLAERLSITVDQVRRYRAGTSAPPSAVHRRATLMEAVSLISDGWQGQGDERHSASA